MPSLSVMQELLASMPAAERARVVAAIADWEAVRDKHGDAGAFAFAVVALTFEMEKP